MDFTNKKVLVMGLGLQGGGVGVALFFAEKGARVIVTDLKTKEELADSLKALKSLNIDYVLGKHREEDFKNVDLIIRNPDVPQNSPYLEIARKNGIPVEMDESLFLKLCPSSQNIIGVTGTRGKTTTTHLIGEILKKAGYQVLLGGNLRGIATLSLLDKITPDTKVVLELSSWQLQGLDEDNISPHIAVITNIYPDHLNRYENMEEYVNDKKVIYKYQTRNDYLVLNRKNKITRQFAKETKSKVIWFSKADIVHLGGAMVSLRQLVDSACHPRGACVLSFKLKGEHNLENLAAAYQVAKIFNVNDKVIREAIHDFKGVPFRLEEVATIDGVTYVNDSTSTIPEATIAALRAYKGRDIILICGGYSKKLDLSQMVKEINQRVKALVLLEGSGTEYLIKNYKLKIKNLGLLGTFNNLKDAVLTAKKSANTGDIILLSPGFASFGMFNNEYDRGEKFNEIVKNLASKQKTN